MHRDGISTLLLFLVLTTIMDPAKDDIGTLLLFLVLTGFLDDIRY